MDNGETYILINITILLSYVGMDPFPRIYPCLKGIVVYIDSHISVEPSGSVNQHTSHPSPFFTLNGPYPLLYPGCRTPFGRGFSS